MDSAQNNWHISSSRPLSDIFRHSFYCVIVTKMKSLLYCDMTPESWKQERGCVFCVVCAEELPWRQFVLQFSSHVEAGSNTSTLALWVVGGDEYGSLESETLKYGCKSHGTRTREWLRWRGPAAASKSHTRPLFRESAPHQQTCNCLTVIKIRP
jgi:hypothetical protein